MLLSIKSIAALSLVPLSFAKPLAVRQEKYDSCSAISGPYNRVDGPNANQNIVGEDEVQTISPNPCPVIGKNVGTPTCVTAEILGLTTPQLLAQNDVCPYLSPASQPISDINVTSCFSYYQSADLTFPCPEGFPIATCRYCNLPDFASELERNLIYTPTTNPPGTELNTAPAEPFKCSAPKCPRFARIPSNTTPPGRPKYARLSASYCSTVASTGTVTSPYAGLLLNYGCNDGLVQAAVNRKWGCYIENNLSAVPGASPSHWCEHGLVPICFYDVRKPFSYPFAPV